MSTSKIVNQLIGESKSRLNENEDATVTFTTKVGTFTMKITFKGWSKYTDRLNFETVCIASSNPDEVPIGYRRDATESEIREYYKLSQNSV